ncbi:hypothetical protein C4J81_03925 [Deltaproteobacteria bacterium Smac51]|nr:hypothetical protein C4J81_03925 [Deltaproteobacteria bacterium Smac51]
MSRKVQRQPETPLTTPQPTPETISILAERLQEVVDVLLTLTAQTQSPPEPDYEEETDYEPEDPPAKTKKKPEQIRCYSIPGFAIRAEQEVMDEFRADSLHDLLNKTTTQFKVISFLLKNVFEDTDVNGEILQFLGEHLSYPIKILDEISSITADFKLHSQRTTG